MKMRWDCGKFCEEEVWREEWEEILAYASLVLPRNIDNILSNAYRILMCAIERNFWNNIFSRSCRKKKEFANWEREQIVNSGEDNWKSLQKK